MVVTDVFRILLISGFLYSKCLVVASQSEEDVDDMKQLYLIKGSFSWHEANAACYESGGELATIESPEDQKAVSRLLEENQSGGWFALRRSSHNLTQWEWSDGRPLGGFSAWHSGEPNGKNDDENCACCVRRAGSSDFKWNDCSCELCERSAICEDVTGFVKTEFEQEIVKKSSRADFFLLRGLYTWDRASAACADNGASLATVQSADDHSDIAALLPDNILGAWIALHRSSSSAKWQWAGSSQVPGFEVWQKGQPDNWGGEENCVEYSLWGSNKWNDCSCSKCLRPALCEKPKNLSSNVISERLTDGTQNECNDLPNDRDVKLGAFRFNGSVINGTPLSDFAKQLADFSNGATRTVFIVHGFMNTYNQRWMHSMKDAILSQDQNQVVVLVGWKHKKTLVGYRAAAIKTQSVAARLGCFVRQFAQLKSGSMRLWGIGHGLGAHIIGQAGRISQAFSRITGLDPAGPLFEQETNGANWNTLAHLRLSRTDAPIVDVIHTDGINNITCAPLLAVGHLGTLTPLGTIDFYPNFGYYQPGTTWKYPWAQHIKSHSMAHLYFTQSITQRDKYKTNVILGNVPSFGKLIEATNNEAEMGYWMDAAGAAKSGLYYLKMDNGIMPEGGSRLNSLFIDSI